LREGGGVSGVKLSGIPQDEAIDLATLTTSDLALGVPTYQAGDLLRFGDDNGEWFTVLPDEQQTDPNYAHAISEEGRHGFFLRSVTHPHLRPVGVVADMWSAYGFSLRPLSVTPTPIIARHPHLLARALFETDPDVIALVTLRSENDISTKRADVMQRCWDRGHAGESPEWRWYVRAVDRAKAMAAVMKVDPTL
jgi:hypothetical protein